MATKIIAGSPQPGPVISKKNARSCQEMPSFLHLHRLCHSSMMLGLGDLWFFTVWPADSPFIFTLSFLPLLYLYQFVEVITSQINDLHKHFWPFSVWWWGCQGLTRLHQNREETLHTCSITSRSYHLCWPRENLIWQPQARSLRLRVHYPNRWSGAWRRPSRELYNENQSAKSWHQQQSLHVKRKM